MQKNFIFIFSRAKSLSFAHIASVNIAFVRTVRQKRLILTDCSKYHKLDIFLVNRFYVISLSINLLFLKSEYNCVTNFMKFRCLLQNFEFYLHSSFSFEIRHNCVIINTIHENLKTFLILDVHHGYCLQFNSFFFSILECSA